MEAEYNFTIPVRYFNSVCRVCLTESKLLIPIYEINFTHNRNPQGSVENTPLTAVLQNYCNVTVHVNDKKPQKVCESCMNALCHAYNIFELLWESDMLLNALLHKHQLKENEREKPSVNSKTNIHQILSDFRNVIPKDDNNSSCPVAFVDIIQDKENNLITLPETGKKNTTSAFSADRLNVENEDRGIELKLVDISHKENNPISLPEHSAPDTGKENMTSDFSPDRLNIENKGRAIEFKLVDISDENMGDVSFVIDPHTRKPLLMRAPCFVDPEGLTRDHTYSISERKFVKLCQRLQRPRRKRIRIRPRKPKKPKLVRNSELKSRKSRKRETHKKSKSKEEPKNETFKCRLCEIELKHIESAFEHLHENHMGTLGCILCSKDFSRCDYVTFHMLSHSDHGVICRRCHKFFKDKESLDLHKAAEEHQKAFTCKICDKKYWSHSKLKLHTEGKHNSNMKPRFQCNLCGVMLKWRHNINSHMRNNHKLDIATNKNFLCHVCARSFTSIMGLNLHFSKMHNGKTPTQSYIKKVKTLPVKGFHCEVCIKSFRKECSYVKHQLSHPGLTVKCLYCDELLEGSEKYEEHRKLKHSSIVCEICGKGFPNIHRLKSHRSSDHNPKTYSCTQCDATFSKARDMSYHRRMSHSTHKPYTCEQCGKKFKQASHKTQHFYCMHSEKNFKCKICKKAFNFNSTLKNHMRSHTGEKPYNCPYCSKTYRDTIGRHKHVKHDHPDKMEAFLIYKKEHQEEENRRVKASCESSDPPL